MLHIDKCRRKKINNFLNYFSIPMCLILLLKYFFLYQIRSYRFQLVLLKNYYLNCWWVIDLKITKNEYLIWTILVKRNFGFQISWKFKTIQMPSLWQEVCNQLTSQLSFKSAQWREALQMFGLCKSLWKKRTFKRSYGHPHWSKTICLHIVSQKIQTVQPSEAAHEVSFFFPNQSGANLLILSKNILCTKIYFWIWIIQTDENAKNFEARIWNLEI